MSLEQIIEQDEGLSTQKPSQPTIDELEMNELKYEYFNFNHTERDKWKDSEEGIELIYKLENDDKYRNIAGCVYYLPQSIIQIWELESNIKFGINSFLVLGQTGVGKEAIAHIIKQIDFLEGKVVSVNCSALPYKTAEAILFGFGKDSGYDTSREGKEGLVDEAQNGVLFLDEFFDSPLEVMPILLRLIENREYTPLGDNEAKEFKGHIVAASNKYPTIMDLDNAIDNGLVRQDLIARFGRPIVIPPLHQRRKEIYHIANNLLNRIVKKLIVDERVQFSDPDKKQLKIGLSDNLKITLRLQNLFFKNNIRDIKHYLEEKVRYLLEANKWNINEDTFFLIIESDEIKKYFKAPDNYSPEQSTKEIKAKHPLPSWDSSELHQIKKNELVGELFKKAESGGSVNSKWVANQCKYLPLFGQNELGQNIHTKLKQSIGCNCGDIADILNNMIRLM